MKLSTLRTYSVLSIPLLGVLPLTGETHSGGLSIEQEVGEYLIDIGYAETPRAGEPARVDINVFTKDGKEVPFTDLWVRIESNSRLLFAGGIHRSAIGLTGFTYSFPEAGTYTIRIRIRNDLTTVAETTFPFQVDKGASEKKSGSVSIPSLILGIAIGAAASLFTWKGLRLAR